MKRFVLVLLGAACAAPRVTHYRGGMNSCHAADANVIECGGRAMAQVECFEPSDEACGALAVRYADGERVFLSRPAGWTPESQTALDADTVLRPEMASDGSMIWFRNAGAGQDVWQIYETDTGILRHADSFQIFQIRQRDRSSVQLWTVHPPPPADTVRPQEQQPQ